MSTSNSLSVNSEYLLYTNYETIYNLKVKVVGIINYDKTKEYTYSVSALAINEKVVDLDNETSDDYLEDKLFYLCIGIDDSLPYLVWDDVIDYTKTTKINATHVYALKLTLNSDLEQNISTIESSILTYIASTYGSAVTATLVSNGEESSSSSSSSSSDETDELTAKIEKCTSIIDKIGQLSSKETLIDKLASSEAISNFNTISTQLEDISNNLSTIKTLLS